MARSMTFGDPPYFADHRGTILSSEDARQGETSGRMRRVLGYSLTLALVAGAVLLAVNWTA